MSVRERLKTYHAAVSPVASHGVHHPLSTEDAVSLAGEMQDSELRHSSLVREGAAAIKKVAKDVPPKGEALFQYAADLKKGADKFWEGFEGQVVDGVTVIRSR